VLDLFEVVLNMIKAPVDVKLSHYDKFFQFSSNHQENNNPLLIVYPPISDPMFGHRNLQTDWKKYLLPTAVLEDTKAILNLETTMNLIGKNYQTVMDRSPDLGMASPGDRIWLCISRNVDAQNSLRSLGNSPRFCFVDRASNDNSKNERQLIWKGAQGTEIKIVSPLTKYLDASKRPSNGPEWEPSYGYTYARDYAILARFCVEPDKNYEPDKRFFYYYLGGIRGLGTWGAGWFIENCSAHLAKIIDESEEDKSGGKVVDIQLLLEVTYRNYKILEVRNVSEQSADFFAERDSLDYIKQQYSNANTYM
jgi:hypothetical protein